MKIITALVFIFMFILAFYFLNDIKMFFYNLGFLNEITINFLVGGILIAIFSLIIVSLI